MRSGNKTLLNGTKAGRVSERAAIRAAGLSYLKAADLRLRRARHGRGFRYLDGNGKAIRDASVIRRLNSLAVPPAYEDVRLAENPRAHLQAIGRDAAGRLQYRYHPDWDAVRERRKAQHLVGLVASLSRIRRSVTKHLAGTEPTRDFAMAAVIELVSQTAIRPGSEAYTKQHGSRGAATLLKSNVSLSGAVVTLKFRAKRGQPIHLIFRSRRFARAVEVLRTLPGKRLFQYRNGDDEIYEVRRRQVNEFLRECAGASISLKDFRTLIASTWVLDRLARTEPAGSAAGRHRQIMAAVKETAENLANTPAVCRRSYVHDTIFNAFESGKLVRFSDAIKVCRTPAGRERVLAEVVSAS
jgi:DNA topoisomerase-1